MIDPARRDAATTATAPATRLAGTSLTAAAANQGATPAGPGARAATVVGRGFGHGKIILLGEHAVVYGHPALAAALARGVRAEVVEGEAVLTAPALGLTARPGDGSPAGAVLGAILNRMDASGLAVRLESDLPLGAGLGSSAAMAAAIAGAVAAARGLDFTVARAGAEAAERVAHGTPSGIDLGAAWSGEVGRFDRATGWTTLRLAHPLTVCVGLTGRSRDTRRQVEAVRRLRDQTPVAARVLELLGEAAAAGERAVSAGDVAELGRLMDLAQGLLAALGVSSAELEAMVHAARAAGALGAKLTGAGGGGAVIALPPAGDAAAAAAILTAWTKAGFEGFSTTIGDTLPRAAHPEPTQGDRS